MPTPRQKHHVLKSAWRDCGPRVRFLAIPLAFLLLSTNSPVLLGHESTFSNEVTLLCRRYLAAFGSERTLLAYHHRLDGPRGVAVLADPAEIAQGLVHGKPVPYGYGSGIQDVALENGQLLFALCEVYDATGDATVGRLARRTFRGLKRVATVSPEPGFVPRGPHPDGTAYYSDSSRDQHAALAEVLWRYGRCKLATANDTRFIRRELEEMARRLESHDWKILVEDRSRVAHVGFGWKQETSVGAVSLLSFLAMAADATENPHWQRLYHRYATENDSLRWRKLLAPDAAEEWKPFTLYSNQFSQALLALKRAEREPGRQRQVSQLLRRLAQRALESDVFDPTSWRRLDWASSATEDEIGSRLAPLGLSSSKRTTVVELWNAFDPAWWQAGDGNVRRLGNKLCFGIPTVAFHKALLSEDPELVATVSPHVRRMVRVFLDHGREYAGGENYNRAVVLGLLLWAAEAK